MKADQITRISLKPAPPPHGALSSRTNVLHGASRDLLEKITVVRLAEKYPAFYGTLKVHHRLHKSPPLVKPDNSTPSPHSV